VGPSYHRLLHNLLHDFVLSRPRSRSLGNCRSLKSLGPARPSRTAQVHPPACFHGPAVHQLLPPRPSPARAARLAAAQPLACAARTLAHARPAAAPSARCPATAPCTLAQPPSQAVRACPASPLRAPAQRARSSLGAALRHAASRAPPAAFCPRTLHGVVDAHAPSAPISRTTTSSIFSHSTHAHVAETSATACSRRRCAAGFTSFSLSPR
jgi:hypothetical protein